MTIHADEATRAIVDGQPSIDADMIVDATEVDWETEYLSMDLAVRVSPMLTRRLSTSVAIPRATPRESLPPTSPPCVRSVRALTRLRLL